MDTKTFDRVQLKAGDRGEFSAVISTFDVIDKDGDVTFPTAFTDGADLVVSSYGHGSWTGALPVGKGRIRVAGDEAVVDGQFFMNTQGGRDTFEAVKQLGGLGQWSYGFDVLDAEPGEKDGQQVRFLKRLDVHEASPVLVGAGVNTRTLATKNAKQEKTMDVVEYKAAIRPHTTAVVNRRWEGDAVVAAIPDDASVSDLRSIFAWWDGDPESKSNYKFPHHHGVDGSANVQALTARIAALNGARGGADIPESDRRAVWNHLAGHLRDADREPPELRSLDSSERKLHLHEEGIEAAAAVSDYIESAVRVAALRAEKGKTLSQINMEALEWVGEDLRRALKEHTNLMRRLRDTPREAVAEELVRFLATQRRSVA